MEWMWILAAVILAVCGLIRLARYGTLFQIYDSPATPEELPTSDVPSPLRPRRPSLSGAVAVEEPDDQVVGDDIEERFAYPPVAPLRKATAS